MAEIKNAIVQLSELIKAFAEMIKNFVDSWKTKIEWVTAPAEDAE